MKELQKQRKLQAERTFNATLSLKSWWLDLFSQNSEKTILEIIASLPSHKTPNEFYAYQTLLQHPNFYRLKQRLIDDFDKAMEEIYCWPSLLTSFYGKMLILDDINVYAIFHEVLLGEANRRHQLKKQRMKAYIASFPVIKGNVPILNKDVCALIFEHLSRGVLVHLKSVSKSFQRFISKQVLPRRTTVCRLCNKWYLPFEKQMCPGHLSPPLDTEEGTHASQRYHSTA